MMMAQHYTVQPGNTLSQIAASYGVSWQSVWVASDPPVKDPNLIYAGEVLTIPGSTGCPGGPEVLRVEGLRAAGVAYASFAIRAGEVTEFAGLISWASRASGAR